MSETSNPNSQKEGTEMGKFTLGADFGTTGVKSILYDPSTDCIFQSDVYDYPTFHPQNMWAEQNPMNWWIAFKKSVKDVMQKAGVTGEDVASIGLSGMGGAAVMIDKDNNILRDTMFWMDTRSQPQSEWLKKNFSDQIIKTNSNVDAIYTVPQVLWIKENQPDIYERTKFMLTISAFSNWKLTGVPASNPCESSLWLTMNQNTCQWDEKMCELVGLDITKLSPLHECSDIIGTVTKAAAEETGFKAGTPVIAGGHDLPSSVLGMGVMKPGQVFYSMGTGSNLAVLTDKPQFNFSMFVERHVLPHTWILDAVMSSSGACLKWFMNSFGKEERDLAEATGRNVFEVFDEEAAQVPPGCQGVVFTPYLAGEIHPIQDGYARATFTGLTFRTNKASMGRAVMEGVCFAVRHNMQTFEKSGIQVSDFRVQGGPSKSKLWMQSLADIMGKSVLTTEVPDASPLGNAILAAQAAGLISDPKEVVDRLVKVNDKFEPNPANKDVYDRLFSIYAGIYEKHAPEYKLIADL
jgi:xylulokinase